MVTLKTIHMVAAQNVRPRYIPWSHTRSIQNWSIHLEGIWSLHPFIPWSMHQNDRRSTYVRIIVLYDPASHRSPFQDVDIGPKIRHMVAFANRNGGCNCEHGWFKWSNSVDMGQGEGPPCTHIVFPVFFPEFFLLGETEDTKKHYNVRPPVVMFVGLDSPHELLGGELPTARKWVISPVISVD